jgi:hypothetical protein
MEYPWQIKETMDLVSPKLVEILNRRASDWLSNKKFYQFVEKQSVGDIREYKSYEDSIMSNLSYYASQFKRNRYDPNSNYKLASKLIIACPWFRQLRHKDSSNKVFSFVTYLNESNKGTKIHSQKTGGQTVIVPWQKGKTVFFAPGDNTWHSWSSNNNWRVTLISFVTYSS